MSSHEKSDCHKYYGKYYILYKIGKNIPSIIDRVLSVCNKKIRWSKANVSNKLPVYLIPIDTKFEDINNYIYRVSTDISASNKYYLATMHNNKIYVVDKSFNNYLLVSYNEKTINSQFFIPPTQETFSLLPDSNIYMVGTPNNVVDGEDNFSSYVGSIFGTTSTTQFPENETQQNQPNRIQKLRTSDDLTGVFKNNQENSNSMTWLIIFLIILFLVVVGIIIYFNFIKNIN